MDEQACDAKTYIQTRAEQTRNLAVQHLHNILGNLIDAENIVDEYLDSLAEEILPSWKLERSVFYEFHNGVKCLLFTTHTLLGKWIDCVVVDTNTPQYDTLLKHIVLAEREDREPMFPRAAVLLLCSKDEKENFESAGWKCADRDDLDDTTRLINTMAEYIIRREG